MPNVETKEALSPARKRLIELMQEINYGRIEELQIRDGEPVFNPPPTVLRQPKRFLSRATNSKYIR